MVAVISRFADGREQWGSGYLVARDRVLTAWHCVVDRESGEEPASWRVRRAIDGVEADVAGTLVSRGSGVDGNWGLDVALVTLADPPWADVEVPRFARVERDRSGELVGCVAVGFPMYQLAGAATLDTAEVRGYIRQGDATVSRTLLLRDPQMGTVAIPPSVEPAQHGRTSPFGGLSGALVFHQGRALGHIVEHHPHKGANAVIVMPVDRLAAAKGANARQIAALLGLTGPDDLPPADGPVAALAGLVQILGDGGDLPVVGALDPYRLGADATRYGNRDTYGAEDPYVPRTVDGELEARLARPGRLVLVVGPSKAGKTRTAFEAVMATWPESRLAKPDASTVRRLVEHPRIARSDWPLVVWLDDLERYLTGPEPLTPTVLSQLLQRPGPTVLVATLRREERARLHRGSPVVADALQVLTDATIVEMAPTSADPGESARARDAYPALDLSEFGLAEQLAGAPAVLAMYRDADPVLRAVLQAAIDWQRTGMPRRGR